MSDAIYDDVIRTESERVEMTVGIYESADCVRDHDFRTETNTHQPLQQTGSDSVKIRNYRAAVVCLVLLCVLLLTAVIVLTESERVEMTVAINESADCVRDHDFRTETNTNQLLQRTESDSVKTRSSRAAVVCLVLLCVLLLTAVIVLCVQIHTNITNQLLSKITNLTEERDQK
ncbi:hypothetical protein Q8A67_023716 [Cirrhinus molitorella]|uniref:Uncharacterized protein n=1 Tax=Cirrhinus molitorella TaxID=172907 RepID=A0AA88P3Z0_9TELE|nr:hypothetical protein Q8A67_023716 [Cirrhinus molitorella]